MENHAFPAVLCALCLGTAIRGGDSRPGADFPRVWMQTVLGRDMEETVRECAAQGVDCVEVPTWGADVCAKSLAALRKYGIRGYTSAGPETSTDVRSIVENDLPCECAVCNAGAYRGLSIDRNLFSFTAGPHEIVVEPPVYAGGQPYERGGVKSGHYFGALRPTGRAEIIVPERLFDGAQHLRVLPCEVLPARPGDAPERDSAAGMSGPEIESRRLVRLRFDLSDCADCLLDKVGIAVYWESDPESDNWKKRGVGQLSVFSPLTREAARANGRFRAGRWAEANGGAFPGADIVAIRFGDECFHLTGWLDHEACSFPLWGFSRSGRDAFNAACRSAAGPGAAMVQPRTLGYPEIYGAEAYGIALRAFHEASAAYVRAFREGVRETAPELAVFRNTTRGGAWSESNDRDGTGQELLARELDFLHLDPYPLRRSGYAADAIPADMGYFAGLARRYGKPLVPWMQAHAYAPGGLGHLTPEDMDRMWAQHAPFRPAGIMWLGFGHSDTPGSLAQMSFPDRAPESWAYAKEFHARIKAEIARTASGGSASASGVPGPPLPSAAKAALVRSYSTRATCCWLSGGRWRNPADRHLEAFALAWGVDCGLRYDVFELDPDPDELAGYDVVVSTAPMPGVPGTRILGLGTEGTVMTDAEFRALRRTFAAEIREGLSRRDAPCGRPLID